MKKISEKMNFNLSQKILSILVLFVESPKYTYVCVYYFPQILPLFL